MKNLKDFIKESMLDNYCWDYDDLILRSNGPITVHHIHNGYR